MSLTICTLAYVSFARRVYSMRSVLVCCCNDLMRINGVADCALVFIFPQERASRTGYSKIMSSIKVRIYSFLAIKDIYAYSMHIEITRVTQA